MNKTDRRILFILFTVFLDTLGIGLLVPIFPNIISRFSASQEALSEQFGLFVGAYAFMQFFAAPILGALSDRFGRKPILLGSLLGAAIDYLLMGFAPTFTLLLIGRIIAGLTGASMTVASSYIIDISNPTERTKRFGYIGAVWGLGFIAGPLLGSALHWIGPQTPFLVAAFLNFLNFIFGLGVLPESLSVRDRRPLSWPLLNPFRSIIGLLRPSAKSFYVWIYFLLFLAGQVFPVNWTLYTQTKFGWTQLQLGFSLSMIGVVIALSQASLVGLLTRRLGETRAITLGLFFQALTFFLFAVASEPWMIFAIIVLFALTGPAGPALQTLISHNTPPNEQGELQGQLVSLGSLSSVIAPVFSTPLFAYFSTRTSVVYFPGIVFFVSSLISFGAFLLWWRYHHTPAKD